MKFTKMHGLGNDYIYIYDQVPENVAELARKWSNRRFGVGSDGLIYIAPSKIADFSMRIFNADGSEAKMCGNGIRCVGKYLYDKGFVDKTHLKIETLSGIKTLDLHIVAGKTRSVTVDMGEASVSDELALDVDGAKVSCVPVDVGNPHVVLFVNDAENAPLVTLGPKIERHTRFPDGVNVEFVQALNETTIRMRVWERGSGVTLACGTGACASVAAAIAKGFCRRDAEVTVVLDGGPLRVKIDRDNKITMVGPAEFVFEGEISE